MSSYTIRTHTPPPSSISRTSTPAYHSSPGASTTETDSLDSSWFPVDPVSPTNTHSNSENSDDDTLSSSIYSIGSDTAHSLSSTEFESESEAILARQVEEEVGGGYIDAEASTVGSQITLSDTSQAQVPLIFPHYDDLENSFNSTASDGTTPSASVQLPLSQMVKGQRSSSYRLEKLAQDKGSGQSEKMELSSGMPVDDGPHDAITSTSDSTETRKEKEAVTAQEIREGVKKDRLRRALATANLANIRGGQKWSLKMSIFTLASLLGLVLATVRYSIAPSSPSEVTQSLPPVQLKPFSILDYLPSSSLMEAPSSIMPDVRLIKNALSLSTKASPSSISEVQQPKSDSKSRSGNYAVALRNSEAGLMAFLQASEAGWQRAREMVRPSTPIVTPVVDYVDGSRGYGQIILGDLKTAWNKTLSGYSHAEFIHYIRDQILATIQLEIQQALLLATYLMEVGKNATKAAKPYIHRGVEHATTFYGHMKVYSPSIKMPTTDIAASVAKAATDSVTSKAIMTSQKGREAIQKARLGLQYLVSEARRRAGSTEMESPMEVKSKMTQVQKGRFSELRNKIRTHRGKAVQNPRKGMLSQKEKVKVTEKRMTIRERLMLALHDAAMPLVV